MNEAEQSLSSLAGDAYRIFETKTRDSGESYVALKDERPDWLQELVHETHGDMLPDDHRYMMIRDTLGFIDDAGEDADLDDLGHEFADAVDVYNHDLIGWLGSHGARQDYCDRAIEELGTPEGSDGVMGRIIAGQYMERLEVFSLVSQALRDHAETLDEGHRHDCTTDRCTDECPHWTG